jgi:uncharacterized protein GlcG (DUF336 family)
VERLEARELLAASPSQVFVAQAYQDLLHRVADTGGLNGFTSVLQQGLASRTQVALAILGSPEYQANQIQSLYSTYLHRGADSFGLGTFGAFLATGGTPEQVAAIMASSSEYAQLHGGDDTNFLKAFYQDALGRPLDAGGQQTFGTALAAGVSRTAVASAVFATSEYLQDQVQSYYAQVLHRTADSSGLGTFVAAMQAGVSGNQILATLLSSPEYAPPDDPSSATAGPTLAASEVQALLQRAAAASASNDAIIAIVDRDGRVLGVRMEAGVAPSIRNDPVMQTFAVDGALAEARTGAFFGNDQAPLTSRTIRFISQSTITQREVQSIPDIADPNSPLRGPGFVAPIGIGAHFPPGIPFTPMVDLFEIEHTNRDSILHPGPDGIKSPTDYIQLPSRFNVPLADIPATIPASEQIQPPESYGLVSGIDPFAQSRGIGTLPGGIPIFKDGHVVGGIGVFFPGKTGFATEENSALDATYNPALRDRSMEAEYMAFAALGGSSAAGVRIGTLGGVAPLPGFDLPFGRIDLVGVQLDIFGPGGTQGVYTLAQFGSALGTRSLAGDTDLPVDLAGDPYLNGSVVPEGWLVTPHDGTGITAADVVRIITQGINQANQTRAAIRLPLDSTTRMVFSVSDKNGNILGLYRMPDATIFSIDVAVAKSRNTTYYADPTQLQPIDQVQGVPPGTAVSSRTIRYLADPRFPEGIDGTPPGPFSVLNDGGTNPLTGVEVGPPLPAAAFQSVDGHDAFFPGTNFHDPNNVTNQNGIVFFPGGVPLYKSVNGGPAVLVGGLGVSGDGVDQDDVVTFAASQGYTPPANVPTADETFVRGVRLPYQKFDRNPQG